MVDFEFPLMLFEMKDVNLKEAEDGGSRESFLSVGLRVSNVYHHHYHQ